MNTLTLGSLLGLIEGCSRPPERMKLPDAFYCGDHDKYWIRLPSKKWMGPVDFDNLVIILKAEFSMAETLAIETARDITYDRQTLAYPDWREIANRLTP